MKIDAILFDWGGTLVDVNGQEQALRGGIDNIARLMGVENDEDARARLGIELLSAEHHAAADPTHREADLEEVIAAWARTLDPAMPAERIAEACELLGRSWVGALSPYAGALEAVRTLRRRGLTLGLVSNCCIAPRFCHQEIARQGFAEHMAFTVFSSEIGWRKPAPAIFNHALTRLADASHPAPDTSHPDADTSSPAGPDSLPAARSPVAAAGRSVPDPARILFVGDSPALDVIAAAGHGMKTALVTRPPGAWPPEDYTRAQPDLTINAVTELPALLA